MKALQDNLSRSQIRNIIDLMRLLLEFSRPLCSQFVPSALAKLPASIPKKNELGQRVLSAGTPGEIREAILALEGVVQSDARRNQL